jgi:hypothetical protein
VADTDAFGLVEIRRIFRDDEGGDPVRALGALVCPRCDAEDFPDARMCNEDFRAVQQIVIALIHGGCLGAPGVGAGPRLSQSEAS